MSRMTREERETLRKWNSEQAGSYRRACKWGNCRALSWPLVLARRTICLNK